jgi:integrase
LLEEELQSNEIWYNPLFLPWLSTGMRNGENRGLIWDCIRCEDGEVLLMKSLRRDGYFTQAHSWAPTKTWKERVAPLTLQVLMILKHKEQMEEIGVYEPYGLLFVPPASHGNIYD